MSRRLVTLSASLGCSLQKLDPINYGDAGAGSGGVDDGGANGESTTGGRNSKGGTSSKGGVSNTGGRSNWGDNGVLTGGVATSSIDSKPVGGATSEGGTAGRSGTSIYGGPDTSPPIPNTSSVLTATNVSWKQLVLNWSASTDNVTPANRLTYRAYQSTTNNISSVSGALSNGTLVGLFTNQFSVVVTLVAGVNNYLAVVVSDEAGNSAIYQPYLYEFSEATNCSANSDCYSGKCTVFYRDADGDGYGDSEVLQGSCQAVTPNGYVNNATDCCDDGGNVTIAASIKPGQLQYFSAPADLLLTCSHMKQFPFDYDCDSAETKYYTFATSQSCPSESGESSDPWWAAGAVAACGVTAKIRVYVKYTTPIGTACDNRDAGEVTQTCR